MNDSAGNTRFIDFLLFQSLKRRTTDLEEETVARWRREAPENEEHHQELSRLLALTEDAYDDRDIPAPPEAAELLGKHVTVSPARRLWRAAGRRLLLAAAVAIAFFSALLLRSPVEKPSFGAREFVTGSGDVATVRLDDGTLIRLAPRTRLVVRDLPGQRAVTLDGRAFFDVAKVQGAPFTVRTRAGEAVVLGTRFEAESTDDELRLMVVEGWVALTVDQNRIELGAGEMGRAVSGALSAPTPVEDMAAGLQWMGDLLIFQQTPIIEVAANMERHFGVPVDVLGSGLDMQTVTATFIDQGFDDVLLIVCRVLAATCRHENGRATIDLTKIAPPTRSAVP